MAFINMDVKKALLEDLGEVRRNLLLLLSAQSSSPISGKLWYQKELFLLSKNNKNLEQEAGFEAYFWGPHSELADEEMADLVQLGIVKSLGNHYELTPIGKDIADTLNQKTSRSEQEIVEDVKNFLNGLKKDELLLFVYISYPETISEAIEFKSLLPKRKDLAISIYRGEKISLGKAAELAGMRVSAFIKELQQRGLPVIEDT